MHPPFAAPPRSIPLVLRLRLLFGGFGNQFGWAMIGFSLIFVWVAGGTEALRTAAFYSGPLGYAEAEVTAVTATGVRVNKVPIDTFHYRYRVDGAELTGSTDYFRDEFAVGDTVTVEYPLQEPARSRIRDLQYGLGLPTLFAALFALAGAVFVALGLRHGAKGIRLLRRGRESTGELVGRVDTGTRINDQPVYKLSFRFKAADGTSYVATATTHDCEALETEDGGQAKGEPLLYNPADPADAVMLDDLPGAPRIGPLGEIRGATAGLLPSLLLPGLTALGHGAWALHVLELI